MMIDRQGDTPGKGGKWPNVDAHGTTAQCSYQQDNATAQPTPSHTRPAGAHPRNEDTTKRTDGNARDGPASSRRASHLPANAAASQSCNRNLGISDTATIDEAGRVPNTAHATDEQVKRTASECANNGNTEHKQHDINNKNEHKQCSKHTRKTKTIPNKRVGGAPPPGTGNTAGEAAANKRPTDQVESDNHYQAGGNQ